MVKLRGRRSTKNPPYERSINRPLICNTFISTVLIVMVVEDSCESFSRRDVGLKIMPFLKPRPSKPEPS